eukprot:354861-Chlamydomonas_euryale.AAC.2
MQPTCGRSLHAVSHARPGMRSRAGPDTHTHPCPWLPHSPPPSLRILTQLGLAVDMVVLDAAWAATHKHSPVAVHLAVSKELHAHRRQLRR